MKKIILLFLAVFFVFSSSASAADDEGLYVGRWIHIDYNGDDYFSFILFDLQEDHTAISIFGASNLDSEGLSGRSLKATWNETKDGIHIVSGHNTSKDVFLTDNGFLAEKFYNEYIVYSRIDQYESDDASNGPVSRSLLETGVQIPAGTYVIGEDIPAGTYRFEMNKTKATVEYYEKSSDIFPSTDFSLDTRSTVYARLKLEEGGILKIQTSSIILSYARDLFLD